MLSLPDVHPQNGKFLEKRPQSNLKRKYQFVQSPSEQTLLSHFASQSLSSHYLERQMPQLVDLVSDTEQVERLAY
jgi:hypothetical protein